MLGSSSFAWKRPPGPETNRHCRVKVTAGDVPDGVGHGEHGQAERHRYAKQADGNVSIWNRTS